MSSRFPPIRDRLRVGHMGPLDEAEDATLRRWLRRGGAASRILAAALVVERGRVARAELMAWLRSPVPGLRRVAVRALGDDPVLERHLAGERTQTVRRRISRQLELPEPDLILPTRRGPRSVRPSLPSVQAPFSAAQARERLRIDPEDVDAILSLGLEGGPADLARLKTLRRSLGKRTENAWWVAVGELGDPRMIPELGRQLSRMDVDPGRGLALRRLAGLALGRIGAPEVAGVLERALEIEALEHEGRPGAGLGIQYPVRGVLLWALGEVQAPRSAALLASYLGTEALGASGGLHLQAIGALWKLGEAARPALERVARGGEQAARENAVALLEVL